MNALFHLEGRYLKSTKAFSPYLYSAARKDLCITKTYNNNINNTHIHKTWVIFGKLQNILSTNILEIDQFFE